MKKIIIGVMGGGSASDKNMENARQLGKLIAESGWVLLNGGRNTGIMEASARGAKEAEGLTIGILPDKNGSRASNYIDIQIRTGANDARNYYNVLSSDVIVACNGRAGTISEISLALKNKKNVILMDFDLGSVFFEYELEGILHKVKSPDEAVRKIKKILNQ